MNLNLQNSQERQEDSHLEASPDSSGSQTPSHPFAQPHAEFVKLLEHIRAASLAPSHTRASGKENTRLLLKAKREASRSFLQPTKSSVAKTRGRNCLQQEGKSDTRSRTYSISQAPPLARSFLLATRVDCAKRQLDNTISRTSQLKAYDSYIKDNLDDLMKERIEIVSIKQQRKVAVTAAQCCVEKAGRREPLKAIDERGNRPHCKGSFVETCDDKKRVNGKPNIRTRCVIDLSRASAIVPSDAYIAIKEDEAEDDCNVGEEDENSISRKSIKSMFKPTFYFEGKKNKRETAPISLEQTTQPSLKDLLLALASDRKRTAEYLNRLTGIEEKYQRLTAKLKTEKLSRLKGVTEKSTGEEGSKELVARYKDVVEKYKRAKSVVDGQMAREKVELAGEFKGCPAI